MRTNTIGIYISADPAIAPRIITASGNADVYALTGWEYFDIVRLGSSGSGDDGDDTEADMWVDDLGLVNGSPFNVVASAIVTEMFKGQCRLHGDVIVFGHDGDGETVDAPHWIMRLVGQHTTRIRPSDTDNGETHDDED